MAARGASREAESPVPPISIGSSAGRIHGGMGLLAPAAEARLLVFRISTMPTTDSARPITRRASVRRRPSQQSPNPALHSVRLGIRDRLTIDFSRSAAASDQRPRRLQEVLPLYLVDKGAEAPSGTGNPSRHRSGLPLAGFGCRVHGADEATHVSTHSILHTYRRHYPSGNQPVVPPLCSRPVGDLPPLAAGRLLRLAVRGLLSVHFTSRPAWSLDFLTTVAPPLAVSAVSGVAPV